MLCYVVCFVSGVSVLDYISYTGYASSWVRVKEAQQHQPSTWMQHRCYVAVCLWCVLCVERDQVGHLHERPNRQPDPLVQHHQLYGDRDVPDGPRGDDHGPRP